MIYKSVLFVGFLVGNVCFRIETHIISVCCFKTCYHNPYFRSVAKFSLALINHCRYSPLFCFLRPFESCQATPSTTASPNGSTPAASVPAKLASSEMPQCTFQWCETAPQQRNIESHLVPTLHAGLDVKMAKHWKQCFANDWPWTLRTKTCANLCSCATREKGPPGLPKGLPSLYVVKQPG